MVQFNQQFLHGHFLNTGLSKITATARTFDYSIRKSSCNLRMTKTWINLSSLHTHLVSLQLRSFVAPFLRSSIHSSRVDRQEHQSLNTAHKIKKIQAKEPDSNASDDDRSRYVDETREFQSGWWFVQDLDACSIDI